MMSSLNAVESRTKDAYIVKGRGKIEGSGTCNNCGE